MIIQWLGHSCFAVEADNYRIILDPYMDGKVPGLRPLRLTAQAVYCSHGHGDHNYVEAVKITDSGKPSPFTVRTVASDHDDKGGSLRGPNTIHILEAEGLRAVHLGDLGAMLTPQQVAEIGTVDVLMIPVGGFYTIDALTAHDNIRTLSPTVAIPMHYRSDAFGFDNIDTLDAFLDVSENVIRYDTDTIDVTRQTPKQTAVLTYL